MLPVSERCAALLCADAVDQALIDLDARIVARKLRDDPYAERAEDEPAHVDDPESESENER